MRDSYRPVADASGIQTIVPVAKGGFGSNNAEEAAAAIAAASSFMLGEPNGYAKLGSDGKLPVAALPTPTSYPTLAGPTEVRLGSVNSYKITNHVPGTVHTVSASLGSVTVLEGDIVFTAPTVFDVAKLTIDGREILIPVTSVKPKAPVLYSAEEGDSPVGQKIQIFVSDYIETSPGLSVLDVQIDTNADFSTASNFTLSGDAVNYIEKTDVLENTTYYVRARFVDKYEVVSDWSLTKTIRIGAFWSSVRVRAMVPMDGGISTWTPYGRSRFVTISQKGSIYRISKGVDGKWKGTKADLNLNKYFTFGYGGVVVSQSMMDLNAVVFLGNKLNDRSTTLILVYFPDTGLFTVTDQAKTAAVGTVDYIYSQYQVRPGQIVFTTYNDIGGGVIHSQLHVYTCTAAGVLSKRLTYPSSPTEVAAGGRNFYGSCIAVSPSGRTLVVGSTGTGVLDVFKRTEENMYFAYSGTLDLGNSATRGSTAISLIDDSTLVARATSGANLVTNTYKLAIISGGTTVTPTLSNTFSTPTANVASPGNYLLYPEAGLLFEQTSPGVYELNIVKYTGSWVSMKKLPVFGSIYDVQSRSLLTYRGTQNDMIIVYE